MFGFLFGSGSHFTAVTYNNQYLSTKNSVTDFIVAKNALQSDENKQNVCPSTKKYNFFSYNGKQYTFEAAKAWSNNDSTISICALIVGTDNAGTYNAGTYNAGRIINIPLFELELYKTGDTIMFDSEDYYKINDTKYKQIKDLPNKTKEITQINNNTFKIEDVTPFKIVDIVRGGKSTKKRKTLRKSTKKTKRKRKTKKEKRRLSKRKKNKYKNKISNKI